MVSDGKDFAIGDNLDLTNRISKKSWWQGTGTELAAKTFLEEGMHTYVTTAGGGFQAKHRYYYNGTAWIDITGFVEIGRTELGSNATSISVAGLTAYKQLMIVAEVSLASNSVEVGITFNNDTGTNYASRHSTDGGADVTDVSAANINPRSASEGVGETIIIVAYIYNNAAGNVKTMTGSYACDNGTSAAVAPRKVEFVGKWANTSAQITRIDLVRVSGAGSYATGSRLIVFGMN